MKDYVDYILKKEKKPVDIEKIYSRVEAFKQIEDSTYELTSTDIEEIDKILSTGVERYEYYKTPGGRYTLLYKTSFRKGRFHGNKIGEGFVVSNTAYLDKSGRRIVKTEKFNIAKSDCNHAVDGDYVLVDIGGNGKKPSVDRILDRNIGNIIGEVTKIGKKYYVKPIDKKKLPLTIELEGEAVNGDIVSVSLDEEKDENYYIGRIIRVFEHKDDPRSDAMLEAFKCGMPEGFSEETMKQIESIPDEVSEKDKIERYDFTDWEIFSMDGADTKDKDDCISLKILNNGNYLLGVHIADVPYYVKEGSPLDKDVFRKATSYYYGGLVEPQLPKKLSNGICSLNENVERLTKTILMEIDRNGKIVSRSLVRSVIKSKASLVYDNVNTLLNTNKGEGIYRELAPTLTSMAELACTLRKNRILGNAIIFNRPELGFVHDSTGKPVEVKLRYENLAYMMIEEFMLIANTNVGEIFKEKGIPCIYRVHDYPNSERLSEFLKLLDIIGIPYKHSVTDILEHKELMQDLAIHINKPGASSLRDMLNANLIRCMSHASYSTYNIGHYGTGFDPYIHFTSPIRRLADYGISRILDQCYFETNPVIRDRNIKKWNDLANDYAIQATKMEKVEEEVEKNVLYMDTAIYLSDYIGQEFEATVTLVSNNGICVQLDNLLEGKVRTRNLGGAYVCNNQTFTLVSIDNNSDYYVGDRLKVVLIATDKNTKSVDFIVKEKIRENRIKDSNHSNQYVKMKAREEQAKKAYYS